MRTETYTRNIYEYDELSDKAKEKVKEMFAEWQSEDSNIFTEDCEYRINSEFPNSDLKVQYDLSYGQGSGFNIYGDLYLPDVVPHINLSEDEKALLKYAFDNLGDSCNMEYNSHYCYCICSQQDYIEEILDNITYFNEDIVEEDISKLGFTMKQLDSALDKFNEETAEYLTNLCGDFEEQGYDFFYHDWTDEEAREMAEANECEFYEDGTLV